jgi:6-pyruvoyltetrahydropterin/6-carboxytetrahydropterin synthase
MESWGIDITKEYFKFSAAHFLIFPDGSAERLHGHNYRVYVEIEAELGEHGLVIDFKMIKPLIRELCDGLDERWLIPGEHGELTCTRRGDGVTEVRHGGRYYAAPDGDVLVLPINNTSSENLATWLGRELRARVERRFPDVVVEGLRLAVEETSGQRGIYRYRADSPAP